MADAPAFSDVAVRPGNERVPSLACSSMAASMQRPRISSISGLAPGPGMPRGSPSVTRLVWRRRSRAGRRPRRLIRALEPLLERAARGEFACWAASPKRRLALILLFDQVPRNAYRGTAAAFAFDREALALAVEGLQLAADAALDPVERVFFYLPLEHAESIEAQDAGFAAFERLAAEAPPNLRDYCEYCGRYARKHRDIIGKFGRFPHRNRVLGRAEHRGGERVAGGRRSELRAVGGARSCPHLIGDIRLDEAPRHFGELGLDAHLERVDALDGRLEADARAHAHLDRQHHLRAHLQRDGVVQFVDVRVRRDFGLQRFLQIFFGRAADDESLDAHRHEDDTHTSTTPMTMDRWRRTRRCR